MQTTLCCKCGQEDISVSYHSCDYDCSYSQKHDEGNEGEHLHYTCKLCGYSWCGVTRDNIEADTPMEEIGYDTVEQLDFEFLAEKQKENQHEKTS